MGSVLVRFRWLIIEQGEVICLRKRNIFSRDRYHRDSGAILRLVPADLEVVPCFTSQ